jgi:hypothetical protein
MLSRVLLEAGDGSAAWGEGGQRELEREREKGAMGLMNAVVF